ncbi:MAG: hypothetical protein WKF64_08460 [Ilumatobacteraceae bacterium]
MTASPRPGADLGGNTVRVVHGPIRLSIVTDGPLPMWAWPEISVLSIAAERLAARLTGEMEPPDDPWSRPVPPDPDPMLDALLDEEERIARDATPAEDAGTTVDEAPASGSEHLPEAPETGRALAPVAKPARRSVPLEERLERVARAALAAKPGQTRRAAVAAELGISDQYAGQLITVARDHGHEIPYDRHPTKWKDTAGPATGLPAIVAAAVINEAKASVASMVKRSAPTPPAPPARPTPAADTKSVTCGCGQTVLRGYLPAHHRSQPHRAWEATQAAAQHLAEVAPPLPDDEEAEPLTWGADGKLPAHPRAHDPGVLPDRAAAGRRAFQ